MLPDKSPETRKDAILVYEIQNCLFPGLKKISWGSSVSICVYVTWTELFSYTTTERNPTEEFQASLCLARCSRLPEGGAEPKTEAFVNKY